MSKSILDRRGGIVFVGGIACLVAAVALGFFLSYQAATKLSHLDPSDYARFDSMGETVQMKASRFWLDSVNLMMWMVFAFGACVTLVGLRLLMKPDLNLGTLPPIGPIRDVLEKRG